MPDIQFFDASSFIAQRITEAEQTLIGKKTELEILLANRRNLEATIASLSVLAPEHQKAIQVELASLKEVLVSTERSLASLESEVEILSQKLAALQAARNLIAVRERP